MPVDFEVHVPPSFHSQVITSSVVSYVTGYLMSSRVAHVSMTPLHLLRFHCYIMTRFLLAWISPSVCMPMLSTQLNASIMS